MSVPSLPSALVRRLPRSRPAFWIACALLLGPLPAQPAEIAELIGSDTAPGDLLGNSIAIDGDTAMVGAWNEPLSGLPGAGAAYVFTRSGGVWSEAHKFLPADTRDNISFGHCVALDGDTLLVGASAGRDPAGTAVGAAYFFERTGGGFVEQQKLTGAAFLFAGRCGNPVALDGDTAAVGTWGWPVSGQDRAGDVQVFVRGGRSARTTHAKLHDPWPVAGRSCASGCMTDEATTPQPDRIYDSGDTLCGELALALRAELRALPPGGVLEVIARDPAAPADVPAYCELTGHPLLAARHPHYWIRKQPE